MEKERLKSLLTGCSFTSERLEYAATNHINWQCFTLQHFANFIIFECISNLFIMEKRYMNNRLNSIAQLYW